MIFEVQTSIIFLREIKGMVSKSTLPSKRELPNGVKLSFPNSSIRRWIMDGVPYARER